MIDYNLIEIQGRYVLVPESNTISLHQMIELNHSASFIFKALKDQTSLKDLTQMYMKQFGLSHKQATVDISNSIKTFKEQGIIRED